MSIVISDPIVLAGHLSGDRRSPEPWCSRKLHNPPAGCKRVVKAANCRSLARGISRQPVRGDGAAINAPADRLRAVLA
jgi:hypothetical protein